MNLKKLLAIHAGLLILFFTHVMGFALALLWIRLVGLSACVAQPRIKDVLRPAAWLAAVLLPSIILLLKLVRGWGQTTKYDPAIAWAWNSFPMHAFAISARPYRRTDDIGWRNVLLHEHRYILAMRRSAGVGQSEGMSFLSRESSASSSICLHPIRDSAATQSKVRVCLGDIRFRLPGRIDRVGIHFPAHSGHNLHHMLPNRYIVAGIED